MTFHDALRAPLRRALSDFADEPTEPYLDIAADLFIAALPDETRRAIEIGEAWQEAEAALPEGWRIWAIDYRPFDVEDGPWCATAAPYQPEARKDLRWTYGATPAAALRALAAKLGIER